MDDPTKLSDDDILRGLQDPAGIQRRQGVVLMALLDRIVEINGLVETLTHRVNVLETRPIRVLPTPGEN
jgi:hypothetical protein